MRRRETSEYEHSFEALGSGVRLLIGQPARRRLGPPPATAFMVEAVMRGVESALTRFDLSSQLSRLNAHPARRRPVSWLLASALQAALRAAERSGGLVDPTLLTDLERAGYVRSRTGMQPAPLAEALAAASARRPARPRPGSAWRAIELDMKARVVSRPPGLELDLGGIGKGLAVDLAAARLEGYASYAVDAGGDIRLGGDRARPRRVEIEHPLAPEPAHALELCAGSVATSGLARRIWRTEDGFAHHLLDPSTGEPAWTGVIQATAVASTALEAEVLAKAALLAGPQRGAALLEPQGGVLILDSGAVQAVGLERRAA